MRAGQRSGTGREKGFLTKWTSRRLVPAAFLAVAVSVCFLLPLRTEALQEKDPHAHFQKPEFCPRCHVLVEGKPDPGRFLVSADSFCLECHRNEELGRSHPRTIRPNDKYTKMKVPKEYRLDDDGRIICLTCHKGHGSFMSTVKVFPAQEPDEGRTSAGMPGYKTFYLRRSDPERGIAPLCDGCHPSL
jgi:hypothetical protein